MISIAGRRNGSGRVRSDFSALAAFSSIAQAAGTSDLVDTQEVPCREIGLTLCEGSHGLIVGEGVDGLERTNTARGGGLSRGAGIGEQFGDIQRARTCSSTSRSAWSGGPGGLGRVQRDVLERLDEVVDFGLGVGVLGDRHDR